VVITVSRGLVGGDFSPAIRESGEVSFPELAAVRQELTPHRGPKNCPTLPKTGVGWATRRGRMGHPPVPPGVAPSRKLPSTRNAV